MLASTGCFRLGNVISTAEWDDKTRIRIVTLPRPKVKLYSEQTPNTDN
jgi:hypothetical protein